MSNPRYRKRISDAVSRAVIQFDESADLATPLVKGRVREIAIANIFQTLLFEHLKIGTGIVTDYLGNESAEVDVVIYSTRCLAPMMYDEKLGIFPVDAALYALEIKSTLSAAEIRDSLRKAESLRSLQYTTGQFSELEGRRIYSSIPLYRVLFAFKSDLSEVGKSELTRYRELDPEADTNPLFQMICVIGRGFWWFCRPSDGNWRWIFHSATSDYDEVIDLAALLLQWATELMGMRAQPTLQPYLLNLKFEDDGTVTRRKDRDAT